VLDFPHQLIHSWPRERSSAIRNRLIGAYRGHHISLVRQCSPLRRPHRACSSPVCTGQLLTAAGHHLDAALVPARVHAAGRCAWLLPHHAQANEGKVRLLGILPSGLPLSMRPSKTRSLEISAKETDGWILDLIADGPDRSRDRCLFASVPSWVGLFCP